MRKFARGVKKAVWDDPKASVKYVAKNPIDTATAAAELAALGITCPICLQSKQLDALVRSARAVYREDGASGLAGYMAGTAAAIAVAKGAAGTRVAVVRHSGEVSITVKTAKGRALKASVENPHHGIQYHATIRTFDTRVKGVGATTRIQFPVNEKIARHLFRLRT